MSPTLSYPQPPTISAAIYADTLEPPDAFDEVCARAVAAGAVPTGTYLIAHAPTFPQFLMLSDLASSLETLQLEPGEAAGVDWRERREIQGARMHVLRAAFTRREVGPVIVEFTPTSQSTGAEERHPVAVTTSAALLSLQQGASLRPRERRQAQATAAFLRGLFQALVEALDPLYGGILVEASLPTPGELVEASLPTPGESAANEVRLGTELFVSSRLLAEDPELEPSLQQLFNAGAWERWGSGTFFSGWGVFNRDGRTVARPLEVASHAARRLGRSLRRRIASPP